MERDPAYIAKQVKFLRSHHKMTQENLADSSGLSTRTIEKIESGKHRPDEQTLRSLARAFKIDIEFFSKPTPEQEARQNAEMERSLRKILLVPTTPIKSARDFINAYTDRHAYRFDVSAVTDDVALEKAAEIIDWIKDIDGLWDEITMSQRLEYARSIFELAQECERHGFSCHMGHHLQQLKQKDKPPLVFNVGLIAFIPQENSDGIRYALIELEGAWETVASDRPAFTSDSSRSSAK